MTAAAPAGNPFTFQRLRIDPVEHRRESYAISQEQQEAAAIFRQILGDQVPAPGEYVDLAVRPVDLALWERLGGLGLHRLGVAPENDGHGGDLTDLVLLAEEFGRVLLPAPFVQATVATRSFERMLAHREDATTRGALKRSLEGEQLTPAMTGPLSTQTPGHRLAQLRLEADCITLLGAQAGPVRLLDGPPVGPIAARAVQEERVLTAAALIGSADRAVRLAVEFAGERRTRGVPIGSLQGISHPLADCAALQDSARNLVRRAAWYLDHEPHAHPELVPASLIHAADVAIRSVEVAVHTHGGAGVCLESEVSQHFLWVQRTVLASTRRADLLAEVGDWLSTTSTHSHGGRVGLQPLRH